MVTSRYLEVGNSRNPGGGVPRPGGGALDGGHEPRGATEGKCRASTLVERLLGRVTRIHAAYSCVHPSVVAAVAAVCGACTMLTMPAVLEAAVVKKAERGGETVGTSIGTDRGKPRARCSTTSRRWCGAYTNTCGAYVAGFVVHADTNTGVLFDAACAVWTRR